MSRISHNCRTVRNKLSSSEIWGAGIISTDSSNQRVLNVLQITDTHLHADTEGTLLGLNTYQSLRLVTAEALSSHVPDLVLATGDLVHDGSPAAYRLIKSHLKELGVPVYCLAGNHDEAQSLRKTLPGGLVRYSDHAFSGNWQFIFLDSTIPGSEAGHLREEQLELLEAHLSKAPDQHTLVCMHHQPVPVGSEWLDTMAVDNPGDFFTIIDRHPQVRGILWGHVHQEYERQRNNVRLMASPSTCIQFKPLSSRFAVDECPPGYRWLRLHPDGRIETGIRRIQEIPVGVEVSSCGY